MITAKMIHEVFITTIPASHRSQWQDISEEARKRYRDMAHRLNEAASLPQPCPFCAFFEKEARPIVEGLHIGPVACCAVCAAGPDLSEMMLAWLEDQ